MLCQKVWIDLGMYRMLLTYGPAKTYGQRLKKKKKGERARECGQLNKKS